MRVILVLTVIWFGLAFCGCSSQQQNSINQAPQNTGTPTPTGSASPLAQATQQPTRSPRSTIDEQRLKVRITEPSDGATVGEKPFIEGTVADASMKVWVIVHPTEVGDYWVQQPASVSEDRTWKVQIHVGEPGTKAGTRFEIRAVANPRLQLTEGKVLDSWPDAQAMSQIIEAVRQ